MGTRVLYLEDEISLGRITSDMLTRNGFDVQWVQDGRRGLELFNAGSFDICVADIMMPGMDGYSFARGVREKTADVPIIFLTARSLTEDVVRGFEAGGSDYLKKPFSIEELIVRMNALLKPMRANHRDEVPQTAFHIGSSYFDYAAMELVSGGKTTVLTHMENELAYRLILNRNNVLDRRQVLKELWGDDSFFNARSMDVFITRIRRHFASDEAISIVNIRGKGYKMIVR